MRIAIPSYKRVLTLFHKTYSMLKRHKDHNLIELTTVFVVAEEEAEYKAMFPDLDIVVGVLGLVEQRQFIYDYYPEGTHIVMMDDDVDKIIGMDKSEANIYEIINLGFEKSEEHGCRLWGIGAVPNPFFMKSEISTHLRFISGPFFGLIKKELLLNPAYSEKEDYYRTCAYYKADGKVIRLNQYAVVTKFYKEKGGMQTDRTLESSQQGAEYVVKEFPLYAKMYFKKGRAELRLRWKKNV